MEQFRGSILAIAFLSAPTVRLADGGRGDFL
jgi:hypothetical protein